MPTPPVPSETVALVERLRQQGNSLRRIVVLAREAGRPLAKSTLQKILGCRRQSTGPLKAGETRLDPPTVCPACGHLIDVVPCRLCAVKKYHAKMRRMIRQAAELSPADKVTRRTRQQPGTHLGGGQRGFHPRSLQLEFDLNPEHLERQRQLQSDRREEGSKPFPHALPTAGDAIRECDAEIAARKVALDRDIESLADEPDPQF